MEALTNVPATVWVAVLAAIASIVATGGNVVMMRRPRNIEADADMVGSASELIDRYKARLDVLEEDFETIRANMKLQSEELDGEKRARRDLEDKYMALETRAENIEVDYIKVESDLEKVTADYKSLEEDFRRLWDGGRLNINQIKRLGHKPAFEPKETIAFRG